MQPGNIVRIGKRFTMDQGLVDDCISGHTAIIVRAAGDNDFLVHLHQYSGGSWEWYVCDTRLEKLSES